MKILAIETAAEACSAALLIDDNLYSRHRLEPRRQSELILPMMDELLQESGLGLSQLDALAFGAGPGSFTGVRIATGVIQGSAFAADIPVIPVSTLAALAQRGYREQGKRRLLPAFDARMQELYWGAYEIDEQGLARAVIRDEVATPERVTLPDGGEWQGLGSGWQRYAAPLMERLGGRVQGMDADLHSSAEDVALLGAAGFRAGLAVAADSVMPVYLRERVAQPPRSG